MIPLNDKVFNSGSRCISPDFFQKLSTPQHPDDLEYVQMRKTLQAALQMPSENRWVADWLFLESDQHFHKNIALTPDVFASAHALHIQHDFFTSPQSAGHIPTSHATKDGDLLLVPAASTDGLTVGYAFMQSRRKMCDSSTTHTSSSTFFGRFVFDCKKHDLLMVMTGLPISLGGLDNNVTVLMTVKWSEQNGCREHCFIACPREEYSFHNLPTRVLSMCNALSDDSYKSPHQPATAPPIFSNSIFANDMADEVTNNILSDLFHDHIMDMSTGSSPDEPPGTLLDCMQMAETVTGAAQMFAPSFAQPSRKLVKELITDQNMLHPDPLLLLNGEGQVSTPLSTLDVCEERVSSPESFDMGSLVDSLAGIESSLKGHFYGSRVNQAFVHPSSGELFAGLSGSVVANIVPADALLTSALQDMATKVYFSSIMSVSTDVRLLTHATPDSISKSSEASEESTLRRSSQSGKTKRSKRERKFTAAVLAPRPVLAERAHPVVIATSETQETLTHVDLSGKNVTDSMSQATASLLLPRPWPPVAIKIATSSSPEMDEATQLEQKREAKRRKNRMSAARSNEKRKKRWDLQKQTLADLRSRVEELTELKKGLALENKRLKEQTLY